MTLRIDLAARRPARRLSSRLFAVAAIAAALLAGRALADQPTPPPMSSPAGTSAPGMALPTGITTPSTTIKLGFDIRGVVDKVDVKPNDIVKAGQPILSLLDTEERATLNMYRLKADTALQVAEAEQTYNVKQIDFQRKVKVWEGEGKKEGSSEALEMKTAEAEMNIAKIRIDEAKHDASVAAAQADAQEARVNRMTKVSPIDGVIRDVMVKPGEQVDETKPVAEIVDLDPLYVEVTLVDAGAVQRLKLGDKINVRYPGETQWRTSTVDRIDPVADAGAGTQPFRLSLPNPEMRNAGFRMEIQLLDGMAAAQ